MKRILLIQTTFYALGLLLYLMLNPGMPPVFELALAIILNAIYYFLKDYPNLSSHFSKNNTLSTKAFPIIIGIYLVSFIVNPKMFFFLPGFYFELKLNSKYRLFYHLLPLVIGPIHFPLILTIFITLLCSLASIVSSLEENAQIQEALSFEEIDRLRYLNQRFKIEQEQLLVMQNERELQSTLEERRRITAEIHDLLGHQLSSVIIQLGALEMIEENQEIKSRLAEIRHILDTSMNNVRSVIHAQRESAVIFETEVKNLIENFDKCEISLTFQQISEMPPLYTHSLTQIIKESLTNIIKHSNATLVQIKFLEINGKWNLLIADNGRIAHHQNFPHTGIGLMNIEERVSQMKGTININASNGFRIFITIPIPEESE